MDYSLFYRYRQARSSHPCLLDRGQRGGSVGNTLWPSAGC
ncbi:unnamed protein product [Ectocarpus sp. 8 AP-2014]